MQNACTRPLDVDDAVALVAVLATLEGLLAAGRLPEDEIALLRRSLEQGGGVLPGADHGELAAALSALNERLRETIG
ncbi:hypothetical protein [Rathayibacter sp. VKM Ac-2630]|uniref:hypothetical protein n=1 Tax=Rathayibacter sp. VKM Ac-2630 TaxID=1938617 RepID=UPI0009825420|nr:hypothetical protein [Rathayibacter sp. VKM Ac-2630]OOB91520.1 hypothetical protein B0T42_05890 [Rathayibacter sp. VKM Ac-2630]